MRVVAGIPGGSRPIRADALMEDALLVVDVLNDFRHEGGDRLLASFRERAEGLRAALDHARASGIPVVYVNDNYGDWSGDRASLLARSVIPEIAPRDDEPLVLKPRYSAFEIGRASCRERV